MTATSNRTIRRFLLVLPLALAACSRAHVRETGQEDAASASGAPLPRPDLVVVQDFAVDPEEVKLDSSVREQLTRLVSGTQTSLKRAQIAAQVRSVATATLVQRIQEMGLPAVGSIGAPPGKNVVTIRGQVLDIDEGNRTRRTLIGFGAGKSTVGADVQVYYERPAHEAQLVTTFEADADSGRAPGLAVGMGAGAAAGHLATSAAVGGGLKLATAHKSAPEAEAEKLADGVAKSLRGVFARQGWVTGG